MRTLESIILALALGSLAGAVEPPPLLFAELGDLTFESGEVLRGARLAYRPAGKLNADKSNAILFPTWFTGTQRSISRRLGAESIELASDCGHLVAGCELDRFKEIIGSFLR